MQKIQITKEISLLKRHKFPYCNSLLIEDDIVAVIDAGFGNELIKKFFQENRIDILITSHVHPDHVAGNCVISAISEAEIFVPEQDIGLAQSFEKLKKVIGIWGQPVENAWDIVIKDTLDFHGYEYGTENTYKDGHVFDLGKIKLQVVHAPGHSDDHYCFFVESEDFFFASDLGIDSFGPWYGYRNSNLTDFIQTLKSIKKMGTGICTSSHFDNILYDPDVWLDRCLKLISIREDKIIRLLRKKPDSIIELAKNQIIYNAVEKFQWPMKDFIIHFEQNMIKEHLRILLKSGRVNQKNGLYFAV